MPTRDSRRKGVTSYLMPDDIERLKRLATLFPTEQGKPNQTRAMEKALKFFEKSITEGNKNANQTK